MNITPAILPHSFEELTEKLSRLDGISSEVQIDICDGVFGLEKTWMPNEGDALPSGFEYEFDVMVEDWQTMIPACIALGAKRVVIHVDRMSEDDVRGLVSSLKEQNVVAGIAVSNDVAIETHLAFLRAARDADFRVYAQVMGIERVGEQGLEFDSTAPERVMAIKRAIGDVHVQVDGAMNPETAPKVIQAGAETLVVGSYLFNGGDVGSSYAQMTNLSSDVD